MLLFKKIKIELWVIFLTLLLSFLFAIGTGILVRQELVGSAKLGFISKTALFLAEIPANFKLLIIGDLVTDEQRFNDITGFNGEKSADNQYLLLSRYDGNKDNYLFHDGRSVVELIDLKTFRVVKTWKPNIDEINSLAEGNPEFKTLKRDKNIKRYRMQHPFLTEDGGLIFHDTSPLIMIDKNSNLVWQNQDDIFHHSIEEDHEGNFWVPTSAKPYLVASQYVDSNQEFDDDALTKISPNGEILFQKSVSNIFIENNLGYLIFPITGFYTTDPIHLNDIQPVLTDGPFWNKGDVFLSLRNQSMIILYRPSSNKIVWKHSGNWTQQHDVNILDNHRISIFDNNLKILQNGGQIVNGNNRLIIYDFELDSFSEYLNSSMIKHDVRTIENGRGHILSNGDLFVEETDSGRLLYFNSDSSIRWQFVNRAKNDRIYKVKWSRILHKNEDIIKINRILGK